MKRPTVTDIEGRYHVAGIAPGAYDVQVEMEGLVVRKRKGTTFYMKPVARGDMTCILADSVRREGPQYTFTQRGIAKVLDLAPGVH